MNRQHQKRLEAAADWYATLLAEEATEGDRQAWQRWFAQSEGNQQAWAEMQAIGQHFAPLRQQDDPVRTAASSVLSAVHEGQRKTQSRRQLLRGVAGLMGVGAAGWLGWQYTPAQRLVLAALADEATPVGEVRQLQLADGSAVWLHSATALNVAFSSEARALQLRSGEILIDTAPDAEHRAFYVRTAHGVMQALGTRFAVRLEGDATRLSVYQGAVHIQPEQRTVKPVVVQAGEQVRFDKRRTMAAEPVQEGYATAWTQGILVADGMPLGQLVAELARFSHAAIDVAPEVAQLQVLGTYPLTDSAMALDLLAQSLPVRVRRTWPWRVSITAS